MILAPNHASFMDHFFCGAYIRRHVQFMAKSQLFGKGVMSWIFSHGGVFPVRRGNQDEEAFMTAFKILERGGAIGMYVEGGRSRTGEVGTEARPGIGRLALESGAAVVPVAILGSHQVRNWRRGQFPKVLVQYGTPIAYERIESSTREQQQSRGRRDPEPDQGAPRRVRAAALRSGDQRRYLFAAMNTATCSPP